MKKQFELNGVNVELSKEQLQEMLKDFDKPVWSIKKYADGDIALIKNGEKWKWVWLWCKGNPYHYNITQLVFHIANAMGYLATKEQIKDVNKKTFNLYFDIADKAIRIDGWFYNPYNKVIDTEAHAEEIIQLIKSSKDLLDYIWMEDK